MIAFGSAIVDGEAYRRYAEPGIRRAAEPDSAVLAFAAAGPPGRSYNLILEAAAGRLDLEALVLVDEKTEIAQPQLCEIARDALRDSGVGAVGCAGARGVRSIAWWEGEIVSATVTHRYEEHHGGELPALSWAHRAPPPAEVDTLDGQLLVLAPWVVRNVRFDEGLVLGHGFDLDVCLSIRAARRTLLVADLSVIQHRSLELVSNFDIWVEAHIAIAEKWASVLDAMPPRRHDGEVEGDECDEKGQVEGKGAADGDDRLWKRRARAAEARREAARAIAFSRMLKLNAQVSELERAFAEKTGTLSWRLTQPLRTINAMRRGRARA